MGEDSTPFLGLLDAAGCNYRQVSAVSAPDTLKEMLQYKSIILENVYRTDLPEGFLKNLKTYVKDYGCGLVACGGEDSLHWADIWIRNWRNFFRSICSCAG